MRVPDAAQGKKVKCPKCQATIAVPAGGAAAKSTTTAQAASGLTNCPSCQRKLKLPASAAGKRVKCPGCSNAFVVPGGAASAAPQTSAQQTPAPAQLQTAAPASFPAALPGSAQAPGSAHVPGAGTSQDWSDDDPFSEEDFDPTRVAGKVVQKTTEIPVGKGPPKKRPAAFYYVPGLLAIIAASINIIVFLTIAGIYIIGLFLVLGGAALIALPFLIRVGIWAFFNISANVHAIVGGLNVMRRTGMTTAGVTCGELLIMPLIIDGIYIFEAIMNEDGDDNPWLKPIIVGSVFAAYNWPPAIWLIAILSGKQAKIDFEEYDDGELDELAEQLTKRAQGGGH